MLSVHIPHGNVLLHLSESLRRNTAYIVLVKATLVLMFAANAKANANANIKVSGQSLVANFT